MKLMKELVRALKYGAVVFAASGIPVAFAQDTGQAGVRLVNPLAGCNDIYCPIVKVTDFLFTISIPLVAIFVLIGGFQMMTAAGNPEKFSTGKKTILYAVGGFVVVLLAGSVASLIKDLFGTA